MAMITTIGAKKSPLTGAFYCPRFDNRLDILVMCCDYWVAQWSAMTGALIMVKHEDERAFPVTMEDGRGESMTNLGMTLRDYFAAKAMAAVIMNPETQRELANMGRDEGMVVISKVAYMQADAMIAERAK